ncbi:hypothetical protein FRC19_011992 [Serendipita sp. 401]|nr:hypothetical protein FRC19_011992 [Serendipita sp. 401]
MAFQRVREHCPNILSKISELHLGTASDEPFSPPPNVVKLTLPDFQLRDLSHALHLTLTEPQIIGTLINFDWTHLVSLDIATAIYSYLPNPIPAISFPRLKTLIIRGSLYTPLSRFSAPQLTDLRFDRAHRSMKKASKGLDDFLSYVFFSLSPSEVIEVLFPLSERTLTSLIPGFSQTNRLKLHFEDEYDGYETIRSVFCNWDNPGNITVKDKPEAASSRSTMLTEHLDLQLKWKYREGMRENWTARMVKVLEDTRDTRLNKIKCTWKGELPLEIDRSAPRTGDDVLEKGS